MSQVIRINKKSKYRTSCSSLKETAVFVHYIHYTIIDY